MVLFYYWIEVLFYMLLHLDLAAGRVYDDFMPPMLKLSRTFYEITKHKPKLYVFQSLFPLHGRVRSPSQDGRIIHFLF